MSNVSQGKMRTEQGTKERTLVRTIAGAGRPLDKDIEISPLQAIDRLQKLSATFREQWVYPSPWIVLEDCWTLPASMPVAKMLEDIDKHGKPIGIIGVAWLESIQRDAILRMPFRRDAKSRETLEVSAQAAINDFNARRKALFLAEVFLDASGENISMHFSFNPPSAPEPGSTKVGHIMYSADGRVRCYSPNKQFADVMEQAKERFNEVIKKSQEMENAAIPKR
jgi:hypothetical protein